MIAKRFSQKEKRFFLLRKKSAPNGSFCMDGGMEPSSGVGAFLQPAPLVFPFSDPAHALRAFQLNGSIEWLSARLAQKTSRMMRAMIPLGLSMNFR